MINIIHYNFKTKQLEFKNKAKEDLNNDELTLLNELTDLFKLIDFINKRRDTVIVNALNHIYIEMKKIEKDMYISINFNRAPITRYKFYKYPETEIPECITDIGKVYYTKTPNGKISKNSCIYKKLTQFITALCGIKYQNETVDQFIILSEMNEV